MMTTVHQRLITAREAEVYVAPLEKHAGNYRLKTKLFAWLKQPLEHHSNLLIEGAPGTGKTSTVIAYLREQFKNPWFYNEEGATTPGVSAACLEELRYWQEGGKYLFQQINGATEKESDLRRKLAEVSDACFVFNEGQIVTHKICFLDEIGELFFRGFDEAVRPMLSEPTTTTFATAQNFHSKRKTDSFKEEDERLLALLRRFSHREQTELPTEADHLRFLAFLIEEWNLKLESKETIKLLVDKAEGIVGLSKRILVRAIDEPDRRLTYKLVNDSDVNPLG